jgi:hypothetical protein
MIGMPLDEGVTRICQGVPVFSYLDHLYPFPLINEPQATQLAPLVISSVLTTPDLREDGLGDEVEVGDDVILGQLRPAPGRRELVPAMAMTRVNSLPRRGATTGVMRPGKRRTSTPTPNRYLFFI